MFAVQLFSSVSGPAVFSSSHAIYQTLKWRLLPAFRARRMERFLRIMKPAAGADILDVGGLPSLNGVPGFWRDYADRFNITLLNLPGAFDRFSKEELAPYRLIEADACKCNLSEMYDIVFANALIEHIGNVHRQKVFAEFVRSRGNGFWIQTPSPVFPVEAHCDVPLWWLISAKRRNSKIMQWNRGENRFLARQMATTRPIWPERLRRLFPESKIMTEYFVGFPKSLIAYRKSQ